MAQVNGTIGNETVELNNAATEQTLVAILNTLQRQNSYILQEIRVLNQIANRRGGPQGAGGGAQPPSTREQEQANEELADSANRVTKQFTPMGKAAMVVGGVLGDLAASAFKTIGNLTSFAGQLLEGTATISGLFNAFKDLPLGLGIVAGLFGKLAKMQEDNLTSYRELTKVGVNFAGDLNEIRLTALALGTTLDGFANIVKTNAEAFAGMGGSVNEGAKNFVAFAKELRSSGVGQQLLALGYSFEELSTSTASYIKMTGGRTAEEMKNTKALTVSAGQYMKELDALAAFTGKSREEQEKQAAAAAQDAAYQQLMQGKSEEEKLKASKALMEIESKYGKAGAEAYKARMLGLPPVTEAAQTLTATVKGFDRAMDGVVKDVQDERKTSKDLDRSLTGLSQTVGRAGKEFGPQMNYILAQSGGALGDVTTMAAKHQNDLYTKGAETADKEMALRNRIMREQETREKSSAAAAAGAQDALKKLGEQLMGALMPVFQLLTPIVYKLAQEFIGFVQENMPAIKQGLQTLADYLKEFVQNLFSKEGQDKIINDIVYYFKLMLIEVKKAMLPKLIYSDKDAEADKAKLNLEKAAYDRKAELARVEMENAEKIKALKAVEAGASKESLEKSIESKQKDINALKSKQVLTEDEKKQLADHEQTQRQLKIQRDIVEGKLKREDIKAAEAKLSERSEVDKLKGRSEEIQKADAAKAKGEMIGTAAGGAVGAVGGAIGGSVAGAWIGGLIGALAGPPGIAVGAAIGKSLGMWMGGVGGAALLGAGGNKAGGAIAGQGSQLTPEELAKYAEKRDSGTVGMTGKLFDSPGLKYLGRPDETILTEGQLKDLIKGTKAIGSDSVLSKLATLQEQSAAQQTDTYKDTIGRFNEKIASLQTDITKQVSSPANTNGIPPLGQELLKEIRNISEKSKDKNSKIDVSPIPKETLESLKKEFAVRSNMQQKLALVAGNGMNPDGTANEAMKAFMTNQQRLSTLTEKISAMQNPQIEKKEKPKEEQSNVAENKMTGPLSGFFSKLPSFNDIAKTVSDIKAGAEKGIMSVGSNIMSAADKAGKIVDNMAAPGAFQTNQQDAQLPISEMQKIAVNNEITIAELQKLNSNIAEMLRYVKDNAETHRRHLDATKGLQGNLYQW